MATYTINSNNIIKLCNYNFSGNILSSDDIYAGNRNDKTGSIIGNLATITVSLKNDPDVSWVHPVFKASTTDISTAKPVAINIDANTSTVSRTCKVYLINSRNKLSTNYIEITLSGKPDMITKWMYMDLTGFDLSNIVICFFNYSSSNGGMISSLLSSVSVPTLLTYYSSSEMSPFIVGDSLLASGLNDLMNFRAVDLSKVHICFQWSDNTDNATFMSNKTDFSGIKLNIKGSEVSGDKSVVMCPNPFYSLSDKTTYESKTYGLVKTSAVFAIIGTFDGSVVKFNTSKLYQQATANMMLSSDDPNNPTELR